MEENIQFEEHNRFINKKTRTKDCYINTDTLSVTQPAPKEHKTIQLYICSYRQSNN